KAYHLACLTSHPDKIGAQGSNSFNLLNSAYNILKDAQLRANLDRLIIESNNPALKLESPKDNSIKSFTTLLLQWPKEQMNTTDTLKSAEKSQPRAHLKPRT